MRLFVTSGEMLAGGVVEDPATRADAPGSAGDDATLMFRYLGPTNELRPLASGEVREQVCVKLRVADGCNVLYACWRWTMGAASIVVAAKRNPGLVGHEECGAAGYTTLDGNAMPVHRPTHGASYSLAAVIERRSLRVSLNDYPVWFGELPPDVLAMRGFVGWRVDNARLADVRLLARGVWR